MYKTAAEENPYLRNFQSANVSKNIYFLSSEVNFLTSVILFKNRRETAGRKKKLFSYILLNKWPV